MSFQVKRIKDYMQSKQNRRSTYEILISILTQKVQTMDGEMIGQFFKNIKI